MPEFKDHESRLESRVVVILFFIIIIIIIIFLFLGRTCTPYLLVERVQVLLLQVSGALSTSLFHVSAILACRLVSITTPWWL